MEKVLFVCTGNTCRSCMAEGILKDAVSKDERLRQRIRVASAGISAIEGDYASSHAIRTLLEEWGIDISQHRSRTLNEKDIAEADLILTMTREHKYTILSYFPEMKEKVFTLKEFVKDGRMDKNLEDYDFALDIIDPYGMNLQMYKKCANEIKEAVGKLVKMFGDI